MKRVIKITAVILIVIVSVSLVLDIGVYVNHLSVNWKPDYPMVSLKKTLSKDVLNDEDYSLLLSQTGLSKTAIDELVKNNKEQTILDIQSDFFKENTYTKEKFAPYTCYHALQYEVKTAPLEKGDIIVTPTTHFSYFNVGHAAIVVDEKKELILNATGYDAKSGIEPLSELTCRPCFTILRPKISYEKRAAAADYAVKNLSELNYSVSVGIIGKKLSEEIAASNCAHIVWRAYKEVGIDIDSNGGLVVLPADIEKSENLEVIQVFGRNPVE